MPAPVTVPGELRWMSTADVLWNRLAGDTPEVRGGRANTSRCLQGDPEARRMATSGIQDGGRVSQLIQHDRSSPSLVRNGSSTPAAEAADATRLQHRPLQVYRGLLAALTRTKAAWTSGGGCSRKNWVPRLPWSRALLPAARA
ncbi:hypothetical protein NDU88_003358 [Pleurodeles waltl]|uniref:Uncharacterized protein n=1 Tax=Pleurodeles waltl TaxID=8319 RepID=A0AAV7KWB6_PLEWA|nr:hypothetical protein NDU88_003358 [Pleurodeles waltl]